MKREIILEVKNLKKSYGEIKAVKDVSFTVKKGSLFAFLGPNGAGKSTTIKMITTLIKKDAGSFKVYESEDETFIRNKIGVVFQDNVLDDFLTVEENLMYRGALYMNNYNKVKERYEYLVDELSLTEITGQKFKTLSGGQKRRVEIARALFSKPEILLLDEPTTGLDPETRILVWKTLNKLKEQENLTIFLTTHYMEEAANADYVVIINKGEIKVEGTPEELKSQYSQDILKIVPKKSKEFETKLLSDKVDYIKNMNQYIFTLTNTTDAIKIINKYESLIEQFEVLKGSLDDVFVNIIGDNNVSNN